MATRSPLLMPSDFNTFANALTWRYRSKYVSVRRSPGSPSQMSAALLRRAVRMWRSMQLTDTLIRPSTNHFAWGGSLQSTTLVHLRLHSSSDANRAQKPSGSRSASSYGVVSLTIASARNSAGGSKTRSSRSNAESSGSIASDMEGSVLNLKAKIYR